MHLLSVYINSYPLITILIDCGMHALTHIMHTCDSNGNKVMPFVIAVVAMEAVAVVILTIVDVC